MGAAEITAFLNHLANADRVSASTQNHALSALLLLYRHVLVEVELPLWVPSDGCLLLAGQRLSPRRSPPDPKPTLDRRSPNDRRAQIGNISSVPRGRTSSLTSPAFH
jgi:hypothetical protein